MPRRLQYLANGMVGCLFTLTLILLPHAPWSFAIALLGEFLFQTGAYCLQIGIVFETIGQNNPQAATTFAFLAAATNIPVTYMMVVDAGTETVRVVFVFSAPGFENYMRCDSVLPNEKVTPLSLEEQRGCAHAGHVIYKDLEENPKK